MSTPQLLVAQISDLHIKRENELAYGMVDTAAALSRCVIELNRLSPRPAMVVVSGDLVDGGTAEEYDHLKRLLAPLELPSLVIPGNHDARAPLRAAFPDQPYAHPGGPLDLTISLAALDLVLLDSSVPGAPYGELSRKTLAFLEATLSAAHDRPALVFLHHPPFSTGIAHMDVQALRNSAELIAILRRHPRVRLVAAGHVHRATLATVAGIAATICPAPNHAVALDLAARLAPSLRLEPPALHLHAWFSGSAFGELVTHYVPIGEFAGPYPFFDNDGRLL